MSTGESVFEAWALPPGTTIPGAVDIAPAVAREGVGGRFRRVDATPEWLGGLVALLTKSGESLRGRSAVELARLIGGVGERFLDAEDELRREALDGVSAVSGLSMPMATRVLDGMAADWTPHRLEALVRAQTGSPSALDGFVPRRDGVDGLEMAIGPALTTQIVAGSVPGVSVTALVRALLVKSPTLLKPGLGDVALPVLFARALAEADPELARSFAVVYWPGGSGALDRAALLGAEAAVVYGSDATVDAVRGLAPKGSRVVEYGNRVSVGIVGRAALAADTVGDTADAVAMAIALFDRRGCVSPQAVFVEAGGKTGVGGFAEVLADRLRRFEITLPSGALSDSEAASLHQARGAIELIALEDEAVALHHGGVEPWTVVTAPSRSLPSGAGRFVVVREYRGPEDLLGVLEPLGSHLQSVGVAGPDLDGGLAERLARAGASRIVPFSEMAFPPPWWHHDGQGPLEVLLRWVDRRGV